MTPVLDLTPEHCKELQKHLHRLLPNATVWAYGSRVKGIARPYSDLDLVVFTSPNQRSRVVELKEALDESPLPFMVDVLIWDELPETFHHTIQEKHVVVQEGSLDNQG